MTYNEIINMVDEMVVMSDNNYHYSGESDLWVDSKEFINKDGIKEVDVDVKEVVEESDSDLANKYCNFFYMLEEEANYSTINSKHRGICYHFDDFIVVLNCRSDWC